jgi:ribonuclease P protein component
MNQRFTKKEHLKSRKLIQELFHSGKAIKAFPLLAVYMPLQNMPTLQVGFSVSKRKLKLAVDRNTVKRRIREAYRLHRDSFELNSKADMVVMFVYIKNGFSDYQQIEKAMKKLMEKLAQTDDVINDNQS